MTSNEEKQIRGARSRVWTKRAVIGRIQLFLFLCIMEIALVIAYMCSILIRTRPEHSSDSGLPSVILVASYESMGWIEAHVEPLRRACAPGKVGLVTSTHNDRLEGIEQFAPSGWAKRVFGHSVARLLVLLRATIREHPDVIVGYHIMPNAIFSIIAGKCTGARTVYQMTSGPPQLIGGGYGCGNPIQRKMEFPSSLIEKMLFRWVRRSDCVVVRGSTAREFVQRNRLGSNCKEITAAINTRKFFPSADPKDYDLICVARVEKAKGIAELLETLSIVRRTHANATLAVVGDGQFLDEARSMAGELEIADSVNFLGLRNDIDRLLRRSKLFVLLSYSEGVSIAVLEAMASGTVVLATNVGDLEDFVIDGISGYLVDQGETPVNVAARVNEILSMRDEELGAIVTRARTEILTRASAESITQSWRKLFEDLLGQLRSESGYTG